MPLDTALPTRGTRPNYTHQWALQPVRLHKFLDHPTHQGADIRSKKKIIIINKNKIQQIVGKKNAG